MVKSNPGAAALAAGIVVLLCSGPVAAASSEAGIQDNSRPATAGIQDDSQPATAGIQADSHPAPAGIQDNWRPGSKPAPQPGGSAGIQDNWRSHHKKHLIQAKPADAAPAAAAASKGG